MCRIRCGDVGAVGLLILLQQEVMQLAELAWSFSPNAEFGVDPAHSITKRVFRDVEGFSNSLFVGIATEPCYKCLFLLWGETVPSSNFS